MGNSATADVAHDTEVVPCPGCGGTDFAVRCWGRDHLFAQPGRYRVVDCRVCGLVHLNPRPTLAALGKHYPDTYFCYRPVGETCLLARPLFAALQHGMTRRRARSIERAVGRLSPATRAVDVGCGTNLLLAHFRRRRGCVGLGVDFNARVCAYVRERLRMPIVQGTLFDAHLPEASQDLVIMTEYLEHEPNPQAVLREARRITRPGGHLVIEVPYIGGLPARIFGRCWSQLDLPRHLAFYTPATFAPLLRRCGYEIRTFHTFGVPFSCGASVLTSLGMRRLGRLTLRDMLLVGIAGLPSLPLTPWLKEFLFVAAEAH